MPLPASEVTTVTITVLPTSSFVDNVSAVGIGLAGAVKTDGGVGVGGFSADLNGDGLAGSSLDLGSLVSV